MKSIFIPFLLTVAPLTLADDIEDVMKVVLGWAEVENDLESKGKLIREDRVQITGSVSQSNQARNLEA